MSSVDILLIVRFETVLVAFLFSITPGNGTTATTYIRFYSVPIGRLRDFDSC